MRLVELPHISIFFEIDDTCIAKLVLGQMIRDGPQMEEMSDTA